MRFPAYRRHEEARIRANDAMMIQLASSRLTSDRLSHCDDQDAFLPDAFPHVPDLRRMNRRLSDVAVLVREGERHFTYMAVPFALSVYHAYVVQCIRLVKQRLDAEEETGPVTLDLVHEALASVAGEAISEDLARMFDLVRHIRNRIIHYGGTEGSHLSDKWNAMSTPAKQSWERLARRPLPIQGSDREMALGLDELIAVLALTKRLAVEVNGVLQTAVPLEQWAAIAVDDYRESQPTRFAHVATRIRRVMGFVRINYGALSLTSKHVEAAIAALS